tara:strand:+ start:1720 stop:2082 length:363 start_codon:yes stop_codon:yes gene_type:complete
MTRKTNTTNQPEFDFKREESHRDSAIDAVEESNLTPIDRAKIDALDNLRDLPREVSSDTILPNLKKYDFSDNRAVGAVMRWLVKEEFIEWTSSTRKSTRRGNHLADRRIYINQLWREERS